MDARTQKAKAERAARLQSLRQKYPWDVPSDPSFGDTIEVPQVMVRPTPEEFGLSEKVITEVKAAYLRKVESGNWWTWIWWLVPLAGVATAIHYLSERSAITRAASESIVGAIIVGFVGAFVTAMIMIIPAVILGAVVGNSKEREAARDPRLSRLCSYTKSLCYFEFWHRRRQWEFWISLSGVQFEIETAKVFRSRGYIATLTKSSGDEGIDIILNNQGEIIAIQCKQYAKSVGQPVVREFWGSLMHLGANRGIFVATKGFTRPAWEFVRGKPIELWDLRKLLAFAEGGEVGETDCGIEQILDAEVVGNEFDAFENRETL